MWSQARNLVSVARECLSVSTVHFFVDVSSQRSRLCVSPSRGGGGGLFVLAPKNFKFCIFLCSCFKLVRSAASQSQLENGLPSSQNFLLRKLFTNQTVKLPKINFS